jgi:hypothetical protein
MNASALVVLAADSNQYALPAWAQWAFGAAAVVAASLTVAAIWRWMGLHFRSYRVSYVDAHLVRGKVPPRLAVIHVGAHQEVTLRIEARTAGGIEFGSVAVRATEGFRRLRFPSRAEPTPAPRSVIEVMRVQDAEKLVFHKEGNWPTELVTYPHHDARAAVVGKFIPPYRRLKGEALFLRVTIRANRLWKGYLGLQLPSADGVLTWHRIRLEARSDEKTSADD